MKCVVVTDKMSDQTPQEAPHGVETERRPGDGEKFQDTVGGLLDNGTDVRKVQKDDIEDKLKRRKFAWRGTDRCDSAMISFDHALRTFEYKIESLMLSSDLRVYVIFVAMFCLFFLLGRNITDNFFFSQSIVDKVVRTEIPLIKQNKPFTSIAEAADFQNFIADVFLTQMIDPEYPTGAPMFIGATRFRTQRVRKDTCQINTAIIPSSMPPAALECYGAWDDKSADDGTVSNAYNQVGRWKYKTCAQMQGGTVTTGMIGTYNCGGYSFLLPFWRNSSDPSSGNIAPYPSTLYERMPKDVASKLYILPALYNDPPFIDNLATRFVTVEFFAYQPALGVFFNMKQFAEVAAGGLWIPNYQARVFQVWTPSSIGKSLYDIVFAVFVLYYVYRFIADLIHFQRSEGKVLAFFFDTWNLVELVNLGIFIGVFALRVMWIIKCINTDLTLNSLVYNPVYPVRLEDIMNLYVFQIYLTSINTVLTFIKILKFFRLNDRLNVLTRTLSESQDSIIGVLLIFLLVVTAFAMTGHGLFGLGVWAFRSVDASFSTLLQMLVGTFDYVSMKNENRVLAGLFFWCYIILAQFCLLNFLIGVLMEAFAEVSKSRTILPLEAVMVKTWEDFKQVMNPSNIAMVLYNTVKCESRDVLLRQAIDHLKAYREKEYAQDRDNAVREDKQLLTKKMFMDAFPPELIEKISEVYLGYVWNDLVYEWDQSETAQEAVASHHNIAMTARGVQDAIGPQLTKMETFADRLSDIEGKLQRLLQHLEA